MYKVLLVAGARPNFMKIAPILRAFTKYPNVCPVLVHTGQHYDFSMSDSFFKDLGIKEPDYNLSVGSGTHAVQTASIMVKFEEVCVKEKPDMVLVVGDVNSTIAAGLVAKKCGLTLAHVEAGLRSGDRRMPEEINRLATDSISDTFFTTEPEANDNLAREGIPAEKIHYVGHVMIDNLLYQLGKLPDREKDLKTYSIKSRLPADYICVTLHRPSNVDNKETLGKIIRVLREIGSTVPILFPCHPRTRKNMVEFELIGHVTERVPAQGTIGPGVYLIDPLGYTDFLYLWKDARVVLTDSGGLQEETTALQVPCITVRETTERPITSQIGTNVVVGTDTVLIEKLCREALKGVWKKSQIPDLWDGRASDRIAAIIASIGSGQTNK